MDRPPKLQSKFNDKELIGRFVEYLAQNGRLGITVNAWPDKTNRQSSDIDAIAGHLAIEHTSVDTVPNQRRDSAWFVQVVKSLEDEFASNLPFRLVLTFPYEAIRPDQDWSGITAALRTWILDESPKLNIGLHKIRLVPGIPFKFHANKRGSTRNGLLFARFAPNDETFPNRLKEQLDQKVGKLSRYKKEGKTTILLVESDDIALMNDGIMWDGLKEAYPEGMPQIDEIWFADTAIPEEIIFTDMTQAVVR